jgi:hypothetical protein
MQASRQTAESNPNHRGTAALPGTRPQLISLARPGGDVTGILGLSRIQRKMPPTAHRVCSIAVHRSSPHGTGHRSALRALIFTLRANLKAGPIRGTLNGDVPPISRNRAAADTFNSEQVDEERVDSALGETSGENDRVGTSLAIATLRTCAFS